MEPELTSPPIAAIINPAAGFWKRLPGCNESAGRVNRVLNWFGDAEVTVYETRSAGDATSRAVDAVLAGHKRVAAIGGDGTVREVAAGLMRAGGGELAILPAGTVNVLARELGLPVKSITECASIAAKGEAIPIDVGLCNGVPFVLHVGIGLDAMAVATVNPALKRRIGRFAYLFRAIVEAVRFQPRLFEISNTDKGDNYSANGHQLFVANVSRYGGEHRFGNSVSLTDGLLDVFACEYRVGTLYGVLADGLQLIRGSFQQSKHIFHSQARSMVVKVTPATGVQVDGDYLGEVGELTICLAEQPLLVVCRRPD